MFRRSSSAVANSREGQLAARLLLLRVLGQLVVDGPHIADRTATLVLRAARPDPCLDVAVQLKEHSPSIAVVLPVDVRAPLHYFEKGGEIAPEPAGHGLPLSKCEAYNRVYEQPCGSS